MPRVCSACVDARRGALDAELRRPDRPTYAELADIFKPLDRQAIRRHAERHLSAAAAEPEAAPAKPPTPAGPKSTTDLLALGSRIERMVNALLDEAASAGSFKDAAAALRVGLEAHAKLVLAYAARTPEFDVERDAAMTAVRDRLAEALAGHPEARQAALVALRGLAE